ncbi:hypothetical protein, conserved [Babesia bigemina]|uniref:Uncharacterized protein n=1 Tax=Babesia bigemina TaxID=5866 RepID=A0A061D380_BABBI|nr:hypothetical protein, conserved [Babesia bigemina]CDR95206.1 hypothetical protein, conserved [Babesia bigemina]|eukprot:XP_012767392.1 hypothetical protein, conserved [Babesia bigemina]
MAKGLRAKTLRRFRTAKRQIVAEAVEVPRLREANKKVRLLQRGIDVTPKLKPNKFLEPDNPEAVIPQRVVQPAIDLRSEAVPLSGLAGMYNRRKFTPEEVRESHFLSVVQKHLLPEKGEIAMDMDEVPQAVSSTAREGNYRRGKAHAHAMKKLNALKKRKR